MSRIVIVQDCLRSGGTERQSVLLANDFSAAGHAVLLLTFRPGGALADTVGGAVARRALQKSDTGLDWFAPGLAGAVASFRPDVVLCMGRMANCFAGSVQRALGATPVLCTMRTGKGLPWLFRRSLRIARHVVANSREAARVLRDTHAVPPEKVSVIYNSLVFPPEEINAPAGFASEAPTGDFPPEKTTPPPDRDAAALALREKWGAGPGTVVLLCVAMFRPEKNQRELIELAARLPDGADWQLWLAGDGSAREVCAALIAEKKLENRVKLAGFYRDPRVLYRAADVAVLTSRSESLSNFLIEAHAHGLPSVAYDIVGVGECGGTAVPPGDQTRFLSALRPLLADTEKRAAESRRVADHASAHFSRERQVAAYLELFARLGGAVP